MSLKAIRTLRSLLALMSLTTAVMAGLMGVWPGVLVWLKVHAAFTLTDAKVTFSRLTREEIDGARAGVGQAAPGLHEDR